MLIQELAKFPKSEEDHTPTEELLLQHEAHDNILPSAPSPQKAVQFCPLPGKDRHLHWRLTKYFADHVNIFHMYSEMGNDKQTEMQPKYLDSHNLSAFVMAPNVGGTWQILTAANYAV
jgi:hypothetical protein